MYAEKERIADGLQEWDEGFRNSRGKKGQVCIASRGEVKKLYLKVSPERNRE